jgi:hypothetical protein
MESPVPIVGILSRIFHWLATHWLAILKAVAVAVGVGIGAVTIWRFIEVTGRPEVQAMTAQVVAVTQAMIPLMMTMTLMHLMMSLTAMIRELVPRKER